MILLAIIYYRQQYLGNSSSIYVTASCDIEVGVSDSVDVLMKQQSSDITPEYLT